MKLPQFLNHEKMSQGEELSTEVQYGRSAFFTAALGAIALSAPAATPGMQPYSNKMEIIIAGATIAVTVAQGVLAFRQPR